MGAGRALGCSVAVLGWAALWLGCGGGPLKTYPVEGTVRLDGQPLASGSVVFVSQLRQGEKAYTARATIGPQGTYRLTTFTPGDGAVAGPHRVAVLASSRERSPMEGGRVQQVVPWHYASPSTSGLEVQVRPGPNRIDLELVSSSGSVSPPGNRSERAGQKN